MKTICIYHSRDLDGWMSAAIVKKWFTEENSNLHKIYDKKEEPVTVYHDFAPHLIMLGWDYGDKIPDLSECDKVIMVDVAFPGNIMLELNKRLGSEFVWLDHHISAIKEVEEVHIDFIKPNGIRDIKFAACELTWQYFFPNDEMPEIVRLLGRYDCFGHKTKVFNMNTDCYNEAEKYLKSIGKLEEFNNNKTSTDGFSLIHYANDVAKRLSEEQKVLEFQYAARGRISNYNEAYKHLISDTPQGERFNSTLVQDMLGEGRGVYRYLCTEAQQTYKKAFPIEFKIEAYTSDVSGNDKEDVSKIYKFLCVNQKRFNPVNFGIDYHKGGYDGFACFWLKNGKWHWSLYNDNRKVDCSVIAKQYNGGGHRGAAGMVISSKEMLSLIGL